MSAELIGGRARRGLHPTMCGEEVSTDAPFVFCSYLMDNNRSESKGVVVDSAKR